jgi:uncharacterized membrane protein YoaK (UPF0700 family)
VLKVVGPPILFFLMGFLLGLFASARISPWSIRAVVCVVLLSPVAALFLLRYFEDFDPDAVSALFLVLPQAIELPLFGLLIGYGLYTLLTVGQASGMGR